MAEAIRKPPEQSAYAIGENMADRLREMIEMSGVLKESDGKIHFSAAYLEPLGLSPQHVTENFANIVVDLEPNLPSRP